LNEFAAPGGQPGFGSASVPVYRDSHETSLTLAVLGGVISVGAAVELAWSGAGVFFGWPITLGLAGAFAALWLTFWRRAASQAMRRPPGFGIAAVIGLAATLPPFLVVVVYAGPFMSFGIGLAVAGVKLRNRALTYWALGVGAVGVFEGFFGIGAGSRSRSGPHGSTPPSMCCWAR